MRRDRDREPGVAAAPQAPAAAPVAPEPPAVVRLPMDPLHRMLRGEIPLGPVPMANGHMLAPFADGDGTGLVWREGQKVVTERIDYNMTDAGARRLGLRAR